MSEKVEVKYIDSIVGDEAETWWDIYDEAFIEVNKKYPCRQSFHKEEFLSILQNPLAKKLVVIVDGEFVSMGIWTADLALAPWISEEYFELNFPDEYERKAIFYFVALLTKPGLQGKDYMKELAGGMTNYIAEHRGFAALDVCEDNSWIPQACVDLGSPFATISLQHLSTQSYWGFHATK